MAVGMVISDFRDLGKLNHPGQLKNSHFNLKMVSLSLYTGHVLEHPLIKLQCFITSK